MKYITVKLTEDQADTIQFVFHWEFYKNMQSDNQYAHFCERINQVIWKAKKLAKAKS
jgi:hypothetical protein